MQSLPQRRVGLAETKPRTPGRPANQPIPVPTATAARREAVFISEIVDVLQLLQEIPPVHQEPHRTRQRQQTQEKVHRPVRVRANWCGRRPPRNTTSRNADVMKMTWKALRDMAVLAGQDGQGIACVGASCMAHSVSPMTRKKNAVNPRYA